MFGSGTSTGCPGCGLEQLQSTALCKRRLDSVSAVLEEEPTPLRGNYETSILLLALCPLQAVTRPPCKASVERRTHFTRQAAHCH